MLAEHDPRNHGQSTGHKGEAVAQVDILLHHGALLVAAIPATLPILPRPKRLARSCSGYPAHGTMTITRKENSGQFPSSCLVHYFVVSSAFLHSGTRGGRTECCRCTMGGATSIRTVV